MCFFFRTSKWNEIRPFWIANRTLKKYSMVLQGLWVTELVSSQTLALWYGSYKLLCKSPLLRNYIGVMADFLMISKLLSNYKQHYPEPLKQKYILHLCHLYLTHVSLVLFQFLWKKKKNLCLWKIWICLSIRLNQLSKIKINGESNTLEGIFSVITEVTCEMQAVPGKYF